MIYRGFCTNITDPEGRMRIKATVPALFGESETDWCEPCVPPGWPVAFNAHTFTDKNDGTASSGDVARTLAHVAKKITPAVGDGVWITFEGNDHEHPIWLGTWKKGS